MNLSTFAPRGLGTLLSVAAIGGAMAFSTANQTPVGRVRGRITLSESGRPLSHVKVTLSSGDAKTQDDDGEGETNANRGEVKRFRAVTNARGEWEIQGVETGFYQVSASTRAHTSPQKSLVVREDETVDVALQLKRSQPDLQVTQRQREFLPGEVVTLPLHGYVDGQTPNTDSLRVRVFRAHLIDILRDPAAAKALGEVANRYERAANLPAELLHPGRGKAPQLIETRTVPLKGADIEGFYHERLPLGRLAPGMYLVDVRHGATSVCAQMAVSDTALIVKKAPGAMLAYAVDSQSGAPRAGAKIQVFQSGHLRFSARADAQGLAQIGLKGDGTGERLLTLASFGPSEATVGQYDSEGTSDETRGDWTLHAYTDRPIYRPGDRVEFKGIMRRTLEAGARYSVPVGQTVEIETRDESGQRIAGSHLQTNAYGSFHDGFELSPEAPSGSYSIVMTVAGEEHTADFSVASYRKPEFAATVVPNEKHYAFGDEVEMMVSSSYYFGAPVAGAKVHYTVMRAPDWASLYAGDDEEDDDSPDGDYSDESGEMVSEGDAVLDANGHATLHFAAQKGEKSADEETQSPDAEPQDQIYSVDVTVTDASEREVEASGSVPVTMGNFRLQAQTEGYFALPNQATTVSVAAHDFDGKPIAGQAIELNCQFQDWDQRNSRVKLSQSVSYPGTTGADGVAHIAISPSREGDMTLSATAKDGQGRAVVATQTLWIAGDDGGDYDAQYNTLSLLTDKKHYKSGETARVLLNAEQSGGTALVSIEGSRLFRAFLVPLKHRSTPVSIALSDAYGPNVTLAVCMVRGKKFASSQAPLRVEVPERALRVAIQSERAKYGPGERATYHVQTTDYAGKPVAANLSFGVVDEAIYALQEDDPGALRRAFYPSNPNSVETAYSFEPLYLGDVSKAEPNIEARRKFVDTAFWQSDLQTDEHGRATVSFALPDNLTTWRATAVAQSLNSAFGRRTQKLVVAKDFFVRLEAPRFFTGGDESQITALVHNDTGQTQQASVRIDAEGLKVSGAENQTISVAPGAVGQIVWPIETDDAGLSFAGQAHLKLSAWTPLSGGKRWTDALETRVPVRPQGRERVDNFVGQISDGAATQKLDLDPVAVASASLVTVRITPSISDALVGGLGYLTGFPYGCTEQTMSRFLPDILVQRALRIRGASTPESQKLAAGLPKMVRDGVTRLRRFQHESGGWGWWETDDDDPWMTSYVIYGLAQARAAGYDVPDEMIAQGRAAALKMLAAPPRKLAAWQLADAQNTRAFTLYALACASPTKSESAQIHAARAGISARNLGAQSLGYLTLLDRKLGTAGADSAWPELESRMAGEGDALAFWQGDGREEWSDWSDKTATATGLRALIATHPNDARIPAILRWLMGRRDLDSWGNTRDTAWVLEAMCDYLGTQTEAPTNSGALKVSLNGKTLETYSLKPGASDSNWTLRIPGPHLRAGNNALRLERTPGGEPIFYAVQLRQTVEGDLPPLTSAIPIKISREYRLLSAPASGANGWKLQSQASSGSFKQGDRVRVRLTIEAPREISYALIEDAFPSGCETTQRGSAEENTEDWNNWWSSTDVRDDRIAFFARHLSRGKHLIEYNLRAQTKGTYAALPTQLQAMYAPDVRAESAPDRVVIE